MLFEHVNDIVMKFLPVYERLQVATAGKDLQKCLSSPSVWAHIKFAADPEVAGMHLHAVDLRKVSTLTKYRIQEARDVEVAFSGGFHGLPEHFAAMLFCSVETVHLHGLFQTLQGEYLQIADVVGAISSLAPLRGATALIMGDLANGIGFIGDFLFSLFGFQGFRLAQTFPILNIFVADPKCSLPFAFSDLGISPNRFCILGWAKAEGLPALPVIRSLGIRESSMEEADMLALFLKLGRSSPSLSFLALSTDSVIFERPRWWYVFANFPLGPLDLLLEFDSCDLGPLIIDADHLHRRISSVLPARTRLHILKPGRKSLEQCCDLMTRQFSASEFISGL